MKQKLEQIKTTVITHVKEHKDAYIAGGVGVVVGGAAVFVVLKLKHTPAAVVQAPVYVDIDGDNNVVSVYNTIMQSVGNADNPSVPIFDTTTNTGFRSIRHAATELGLNDRDISWHLKGNLDDVGGHKFVNLLPTE